MRIKCSTVRSFLDNLKEQKTYNNTIFVDKYWEPINGTRRDATVFDIVMHLTCVVVYQDGGEALLDCAVDCGRDREEDPVLEASVKYDEFFATISAYCDEHGLVVKPGIVDM